MGLVGIALGCAVALGAYQHPLGIFDGAGVLIPEPHALLLTEGIGVRIISPYKEGVRSCGDVVMFRFAKNVIVREQRARLYTRPQYSSGPSCVFDWAVESICLSPVKGNGRHSVATAVVIGRSLTAIFHPDFKLDRQADLKLSDMDAHHCDVGAQLLFGAVLCDTNGVLRSDSGSVRLVQSAREKSYANKGRPEQVARPLRHFLLGHKIALGAFIFAAGMAISVLGLSSSRDKFSELFRSDLLGFGMYFGGAMLAATGVVLVLQ